jgi:FKBP-type peptidyl-prolyl cis-trans isomerase
MKTHAIIALACLSLLATACGSKEENLQEEALELMEDAVDIMKSVKDVESAEKAKPKLQKLGKRMQEMSKDLEAISKEEKEAFEKKHEEKIKKIVSGMMQEAARIGSDPAMAPILADAMEGFDK